MNRNKMFAECRVGGHSANLCLRSAPDSALGKPFFMLRKKRKKRCLPSAGLGSARCLYFLAQSLGIVKFLATAPKIAMWYVLTNTERIRKLMDIPL